MNCLNHMDRITLSTDIVMNMIKIYEYKGKEFYYKEVFDKDIDSISQQTIEKETVYLSLLFGVNLSDQRRKLLLKRDAVAKNKDEVLFLNIKNCFYELHDHIEEFEYNPNQFLDMAKFLFKNVKDQAISFDSKSVLVNNHSLIPDRKIVSKRDEFESLLQLYEKMLKSNNYELTLLITNFFVDFVNSKPLKSENDKIGLMILYITLFKEKFELFRYTSFFEIVYNMKNIFNQNLLQAGYDWDKGFSQTTPLHQSIISILLTGYQKVENLLRDYIFDSDLNKSDNIENTISKLGELFTKDDIRNIHPYVSDSTINRTLKRLRDNGSIKPLGVGRSAKWIKIFGNSKPDIYKQYSLFDDHE